MAISVLRQPVAMASVALAALETLPAACYGRSLAAREPVSAALSFAGSLAGTSATYLLLLLMLSSQRAWLRYAGIGAVAITTVLLQLVHFGIYRELSSLPTVSIADFARQNWRYASALFLDRLDLPSLALSSLLAAGLAGVLQKAIRAHARPSGRTLAGLGLVAVSSFALVRAPFMSLSQHAAWLAAHSARGSGMINEAWLPDRARPATQPARNPINVIVFRLEEIADAATTLTRPELPTTPFLKALVDGQPEEAFVARQHFSNATATDVSVIGMFMGLSPAAPLEAQRRVPMLWDYFHAAGYATSLFLPDHLEWGDFRRRFQARPGEMNLHVIVDANNAGQPLVYDHSLNDSAVTAAALAHQRRQGWAEPFLQIISLRMPHALGEGARMNQLPDAAWPNEPPELHDYYDAIVHDDLLMRDYVAQIPASVRQRTALVFVSDHGTCLFARPDGSGSLPRIDNYHAEATRVPFVLLLPGVAQQALPGDAIARLRVNLGTHATSNIDLVPTLLGLVGIEPVTVGVPRADVLLGRDLTRPLGPTRSIIQLNTGPLRRWEREHFGLVLDDGSFHYLFGMAGEQLFDMHRDPLEQTSLSNEPTAAAALARARALTVELPELWRIRRKYAASSAEDGAGRNAPGGGVYSLARFTLHECLAQPTDVPCPNGFLAWGPYVHGARNSDVRLSYDIDVAHEGLEIWLDISERDGRQELARTTPRLLHPGSERLELGVHLETDTTGIEGRLHVRVDRDERGGDGVVARNAIVIRDAMLTIAAAPR